MAFHYQLTPELAKELRSLPGMHAGAWRLWSYLATLDPFGDSYQELPELVVILSECNIRKTTFYEAIALFTKHEIFDLQPGKMSYRNLRGQRIVRHGKLNSATAEDQFATAESQFATAESQSPKPPSAKDRQCTNNRLTDRSEQQNSKKPPTHPVKADAPSSLNSEGFGTRSDLYKQELEALLELVKAARVRPNQTIEETILRTLYNEGPAAGAQTVKNAISSLEEARAKGLVKNPGGFLVAALRAKFTSNGAKKEARHRKQGHKPESLNQIEMQIDGYLLNGRRDWALNKLQSLWDEGLEDPVEAVCTLRTDWQFSVTVEGVRDGCP